MRQHTLPLWQGTDESLQWKHGVDRVASCDGRHGCLKRDVFVPTLTFLQGASRAHFPSVVPQSSTRRQGPGETVSCVTQPPTNPTTASTKYYLHRRNMLEYVALDGLNRRNTQRNNHTRSPSSCSPRNETSGASDPSRRKLSPAQPPLLRRH